MVASGRGRPVGRTPVLGWAEGWLLLCEIQTADSGTGPIHQALSHSLSVLPGGFVCPLLTVWNRGRYPGTLRAAGFFCISLGRGGLALEYAK